MSSTGQSSGLGAERRLAPSQALSLTERVTAVADMAVRSPYFFWDWGEAVAIQALMIAGEALGERRYTDWVRTRLDLWRQIHPNPFWPDHLGPGVALIRHYHDTGDPAVLAYAERLADHLMSLPVAGTSARILRPDKPDIDHFVWVDSLYTDGPFLCELGRATGTSAYIDEGARQSDGISASLQDPATGLFAHRYDANTGTTNGVFWGRGCGWAALGLGHTLSALPRSHRLWGALAGRLERFAATAAALQEPSGHWRAVIDQPETAPESSTTALIAEGLALGIDAGALSDGYSAVVERAWHAVKDEVASDGRVENVSQRSPASTSWQDYARLPHGGCYPWGQGPWLLIACRMLAWRSNRSA